MRLMTQNMSENQVFLKSRDLYMDTSTYINNIKGMVKLAKRNISTYFIVYLLDEPIQVN